jgi:hypothetical protein
MLRNLRRGSANHYSLINLTRLISFASVCNSNRYIPLFNAKTSISFLFELSNLSFKITLPLKS